MGNEYVEGQAVEISRWVVVLVAGVLASAVTSCFAVIYGFGRSIDVHAVRIQEHDRRFEAIDRKLYAPRWSENDHDKYASQHNAAHRVLRSDISAIRNQQTKHARTRWHDGAGQRMEWLERQMAKCEKDLRKGRVNE